MNVGGRPPKFTDPEQLQNLVDEYFDTTDRPTLAGLAVNLGMSRSSLYNYAEKNGFLDIIKSAQARVEALYEERAVYDGQPTGVIFALKNMGWTDRLATDHTTKGEAINKPDLSKLTDDELRAIIDLQRKSGIIQP